MKIKISAFIFVLCIFALTDCSNVLVRDPRVYNRNNSSDKARVLTAEPELELTGGIDAFDDTAQWYNKKDSNGDEREPDAGGFDASEFDAMSIRGWFDGSNVPVYTLTDGHNWGDCTDEASREYTHKGAPDTEGRGWTISSVTYYLYKGINPNYSGSGSYNTALQTTAGGNPKLSRFYFYRFTGKGGGIQALDNYLIVIDTYSKLIFAFSKPVEFSSMGAPTKWAATDAEKYNGLIYQFYMYDPVGYVKKAADGTHETVLYQWFKDNLAQGNYTAQIKGYDKVAQKTADGAGKSPFNNKTVDFFNSNMKLLSVNNRLFYQRQKNPDGTNGLILYTYSVSSDGKTITRSAASWNGLAADAPLTDKAYGIGDGITAVSGNLTPGGTVTLSDEMRTLTLETGDGTEIARSNFTDPGPAWLLRVRGQTYEDDVFTYQFSEDGKTIKCLKNGKDYAVYTFAQEDAGDRAVYKASGYWGLRLADNGNTLYWSGSAWASAVTTPTDGVSSFPARRRLKAENSLSQSLKNTVFRMREKDADGGWGENLTTYEFNADGTSVLVSKTPWGQSTSETQTLIVTDTGGSDGTFTGTIGGTDAELNTAVSPWTLTVGSQKYELNWADPGPAWLYRVKGKKYKNGKNSYTFSPDGKTLTMNGHNYTYDGNASDTLRTVYKYNWARFYGLELSENDNTVKMTGSSSRDVILWHTLDWEAYLVNQ